MVMPIPPVSSRPRLFQSASPVAAVTPNARYPYQARPQRHPQDRAPDIAGRMRRAAESAVDWMNAAGEAKTSAGHLGADAAVWQQRIVLSDEAAVLSGQAADGAAIATYRIGVEAVAASQTNSGYELVKNGSSVIEAGVHAFRLSSDGKTKQLNVTIGPSDTNAQAIVRLRDAINDSGMGVRADIAENKSAGTVRLDVRTEATGRRYAFELTDTDGSAVIATGIARIAAEAQDAVCRVDGGRTVVSPANTISLDRGRVKLVLSAIADAEVEVKVGLDAEAIVDRVKQTIRSADKLSDVVRRHADDLDPAILKPLAEAMASGAAEMLGIERDLTGWRLDEDALRAAIARTPEPVRRAIAGPDGLATRIGRTMDRYASMPAESLFSDAARGAHVYAPHRSGVRLDRMTPAGGWYVNTRY